MRCRRLGRTGTVVSEIGLGTNNLGTRLDEERSRAVLDAAADAGVTLIDTADVYGDGASETIIGSWLPGRRDEVVLATKVGLRAGRGPNETGASAVWIRRSVERSLRRLGTDHVDLLQLHAPDPATPLDETLRALDDLVRAGLVRYVGLSNHAPWEAATAVERARGRGWSVPVAVQSEWSLLRREAEAELLPMAAHHGLGVLVYRPLARGVLTGKYHRDHDLPPGSRLARDRDLADELLVPEAHDVVDRVRARAGTLGVAPAAVALAWLLREPAVSSVLVGASSPAQLEESVRAVDGVIPTDDLGQLVPEPRGRDVVARRELRRRADGAPVRVD